MSKPPPSSLQEPSVLSLQRIGSHTEKAPQPHALRASSLAASTSEKKLAMKDNEDFYIYKLQAKDLQQQLESAKKENEGLLEEMSKLQCDFDQVSADLKLILQDKELLNQNLEEQEKLVSEKNIENLSLMSKYDKTIKQFEEVKAQLVQELDQMRERINNNMQDKDKEATLKEQENESKIQTFQQEIQTLLQEIEEANKTIENQQQEFKTHSEK